MQPVRGPRGSCPSCLNPVHAPLCQTCPRRVWFNVAAFPRAAFQFSGVGRIDAIRFEVQGELSIKGTSLRIGEQERCGTLADGVPGIPKDVRLVVQAEPIKW